MFKKLLITYFSLYLALSPVVNATTLTTNKNINLAGSNLSTNNKLNLNTNNVVLTTTQQVTDFYSGNSKNYLKENATTHLKSQIKATDININANKQIIIKGANLQADNQINIQSKALNIASVKDTTNTQLHSESKKIMGIKIMGIKNNGDRLLYNHKNTIHIQSNPNPVKIPPCSKNC